MLTLTCGRRRLDGLGTGLACPTNRNHLQKHMPDVCLGTVCVVSVTKNVPMNFEYGALKKTTEQETMEANNLTLSKIPVTIGLVWSVAGPQLEIFWVACNIPGAFAITANWCTLFCRMWVYLQEKPTILGKCRQQGSKPRRSGQSRVS